MILNVIGLIIGIAVFAAGLYYLVKEKEDKESKKIYTIVSIAGFVIAVVAISKFVL